MSENEICEGCQKRDREIATLKERMAYLVNDVQQAQHDTLLKNRDIGRLERELSVVRQDEAEHPDIRRLLELWRDEVRGSQKGPKPDITVASKRYSKCRTWVKRKGVERVERAILGTLEDPWAMGTLPRCAGRTFNDLAKHILKDEESFERFERLYLEKQEKLEAQREMEAERQAAEVENAAALPSEDHVTIWANRAQDHDTLLARLKAVKGWTAHTLEALKIGWDGQRLVFPIHDEDGHLINVSRYLPGGKPKMLAPKGRPRSLFPAPERIHGDELWLVEGEPDAVSAWEIGLPAVAIPGAAAWSDEWVPRLIAKKVRICFDCDVPGRRAAARALEDFLSLPDEIDVRVVDLAPDRDDGYDLSDFVLAGGKAHELRALVERRGLRAVA